MVRAQPAPGQELRAPARDRRDAALRRHGAPDAPEVGQARALKLLNSISEVRPASSYSRAGEGWRGRPAGLDGGGVCRRTAPCPWSSACPEAPGVAGDLRVPPSIMPAR